MPDHFAVLRAKGYELARVDGNERQGNQLIEYGPGVAEYIEAHGLHVSPPKLEPVKPGAAAMVYKIRISNFDVRGPHYELVPSKKDLVVDAKSRAYKIGGNHLLIVSDSSIPGTKDLAEFIPEGPLDAATLELRLQNDVPEDMVPFPDSELHARGGTSEVAPSSAQNKVEQIRNERARQIIVNFGVSKVIPILSEGISAGRIKTKQDALSIVDSQTTEDMVVRSICEAQNAITREENGNRIFIATRTGKEYSDYWPAIREKLSNLIETESGLR